MMRVVIAVGAPCRSRSGGGAAAGGAAEDTAGRLVRARRLHAAARQAAQHEPGGPWRRHLFVPEARRSGSSRDGAGGRG